VSTVIVADVLSPEEIPSNDAEPLVPVAQCPSPRRNVAEDGTPPALICETEIEPLMLPRPPYPRKTLKPLIALAVRTWPWVGRTLGSRSVALPPMPCAWIVAVPATEPANMSELTMGFAIYKFLT